MDINRLKQLAGINIDEAYDSDFDDVAPEDKGSLYGVTIHQSPYRPKKAQEIADYIMNLPLSKYEYQIYNKPGSSNINIKVDCLTKSADKEFVSFFKHNGRAKYFYTDPASGNMVDMVTIRELNRPAPPKPEPEAPKPVEPKKPELTPDPPKSTDTIN